MVSPKLRVALENVPACRATRAKTACARWPHMTACILTLKRNDNVCMRFLPFIIVHRAHSARTTRDPATNSSKEPKAWAMHVLAARNWSVRGSQHCPRNFALCRQARQSTPQCARGMEQPVRVITHSFPNGGNAVRLLRVLVVAARLAEHMAARRTPCLKAGPTPTATYSDVLI